MQCPKCGGTEFWDNRLTKKNPRGPDYRCKQRECGGAVWLTPKGGGAAAARPPQYEIGDPGPYVSPAPQVSAPPAPPVQPQQNNVQRAVVLSAGDVSLMWDCLAAGTDLVLRAIKEIDAKAPGNDIVFTGDNICSVAASLFIQSQRRG